MQFRTSSLAEVVAPRGLVGGPFGSNLGKRDYVADGVPVIRGQDLDHGRFVRFDDCVHVTPDKAESELRGNQALAGDLVFTQRGTLGQVALMPKGAHYQRAVISQSQMRLRVDPALADPMYIYYACSTAAFNQKLLDSAIVTGVPHINLGILSGLEIPLPRLAEQQRIAGVLGAFDDLIETNELQIRQVRELSALAYRRAKAGNDQTMRLGDVVSVNPRQIKAGASSSLTYLDIASVGDGLVEFSDPIAWVDAPSRARRLADPGSTIWSTVRPNRRAHALLVSTPDDLVVSTGLAVLTPQLIGPAELFAATDEPEFVDYLMTRAEGSAYPAVRADTFEEAQIARLTPEESEIFEAQIWPLWQIVDALQEENRQLRRTRDELLPLLMSGKILVCDLEEAA